MFFVRDRAGPPSAFEVPKARFSLRIAEGPSLLSLFAHALSRHPFNQQIFLTAYETPQGPPGSARSALKAAAGQMASKSCCFCLRNVYLDAFLSLSLQQLLLQRLAGSALSWRGPGAAAACAAAATDAAQASCPVRGDSGGEANVAALQNDGLVILKLDRFTAQVVGLDTWMHLPHFMRRSLPSGTRYLKINVQHPAVLRHQKQRTQTELTLQMQQQQQTQQQQQQQQQRGVVHGSPPSRLYERLRRSLRSLDPIDFLAATAPPEDDEDGVEKVRRLADKLQGLLRASGSEAASCRPVQLHCRLSEYSGGILDMTEEAAWAAAAAASVDTPEGEGIMIAPDLALAHMPQPLLLPDWGQLFAAAAAVAQKQRTPQQNGETAATLVVRQKSMRRILCKNAARMSSLANEKKAGGSVGKGEDDGSNSSRCTSSSEPEDSRRQFPPLRPIYLDALQQLHERQRQMRAQRPQQRIKKHQVKGETPDVEGPTEEALQLAAPPSFRDRPAAEALVSSVTEYLGSLAMDLPMRKEDFGWLREAHRMTDSRGVHVASVSGGLIHSTAVTSAAESLCHWLRCQGQGAWAAVSVVGTAETPVVYTGQPHGSDLTGESTLHLLLVAEQGGHIRGMLLQTIAACDATTTLP